MAKVTKLHPKRRPRTLGVTPCSSSSHHPKSCGEVQRKRRKRLSEMKDMDSITCCVCMEFPHNAALLLCSSHDKGCRPFMCATGCRYSNCLEQYKKANNKVLSDQRTGFTVDRLDGKSGITNILCPLCRGPVKGWTVVAPVRKYFNSKKRVCMQDGCSFSGSYKELRKHVKAEHPWAHPREVDPLLSEKWKKLENDRELEDVYSTIRSTMPGAIVMGDYVIENNYHDFYSDYDTDDYSLDDEHFTGESDDEHFTGESDDEHFTGESDDEHFTEESGARLHHLVRRTVVVDRRPWRRAGRRL